MSICQIFGVVGLLRVCVAIAKVSSCTFHLNAFFHVLSQVLLQSKVERTRRGRLTIPGGLLISAKEKKKLKTKKKKEFKKIHVTLSEPKRDLNTCSCYAIFWVSLLKNCISPELYSIWSLLAISPQTSQFKNTWFYCTLLFTTGNMPLSCVYLGPTQKHSSCKNIGILKIIINMPLGLVMQGSISKTLEQPTMLCTEQDMDFVIQELFHCG